MDIQVDVPQDTEIRVKMLSAGICHTDISNIRGFMTKPYHFPKVLGHEGVGIVESLGPEVKGFDVGDMVIAPTYGECGECSSCRSGRTNVCQKYGANDPPMEPDGSSRFSFVDENGKKQFLYTTSSPAPRGHSTWSSTPTTPSSSTTTTSLRRTAASCPAPSPPATAPPGSKAASGQETPSPSMAPALLVSR
ncbi:unnamed protein product [Linum tenue]|uniref:Alcohol dehydrogenase-like N-terminal domain-containing protein n=1 Tax=Linum tenue TaxID=586396 RepID=A0AAV0RJC5_9ROSI|nr:unnamed protein product [Linum tenue]